ncbi:MAG: hypothetical protein K2Q26_02180 [Bdellovibrionales bacterium]|nr:hypothetical protein [Bdellovibrionales bacterium]
MKTIVSLFVLLFAFNVFAVEDFSFSCDIEGTAVVSKPGIQQAPDNPVVGLEIKVLNKQVPLYVIKATFAGVEKDLFATDWTKTDNLSQKGKDLLSLLELFYGIDAANVDVLRAGIPANILEDFAYLELKDKSGTLTKLGFKGINPTECK